MARMRMAWTLKRERGRDMVLAVDVCTGGGVDATGVSSTMFAEKRPITEVPLVSPSTS